MVAGLQFLAIHAHVTIPPGGEITKRQPFLVKADVSSEIEGDTNAALDAIPSGRLADRSIPDD
jgi:hypothetical protein